MLSDAQMEAFEAEGMVLVDTLSVHGGLTAAQLDEAERTWDRLALGPGAPPKEQDEGFIRLISHPVFENIAKQVLRAEEVKLIELGATNRPPTDQPQAAPHLQREHWAKGAHIDLQITTADWNATPRRDLLALWLWVGDVSPDRAAMRVLPGSHRVIMRHWDSVLSAERISPSHAATASSHSRALITPLTLSIFPAPLACSRVWTTTSASRCQ